VSRRIVEWGIRTPDGDIVVVQPDATGVVGGLFTPEEFARIRAEKVGGSVVCRETLIVTGSWTEAPPRPPRDDDYSTEAINRTTTEDD